MKEKKCQMLANEFSRCMFNYNAEPKTSAKHGAHYSSIDLRRGGVSSSRADGSKSKEELHFNCIDFLNYELNGNVSFFFL
jgi:hypothetical protein